MSTYRLDRLVTPRSIALVGASPRERSLGRIVFRNLREAGFAGPLNLVNPYHDAIDGVTTFEDLQALPAAPDIIIVTAPAPRPTSSPRLAPLAPPRPWSSAQVWNRVRALGRSSGPARARAQHPPARP